MTDVPLLEVDSLRTEFRSGVTVLRYEPKR